MKKKSQPQSSIGKYFAELKEKEKEVVKDANLKASSKKKKSKKQ